MTKELCKSKPSVNTIYLTTETGTGGASCLGNGNDDIFGCAFEDGSCINEIYINCTACFLSCINCGILNAFISSQQSPGTWYIHTHTHTHCTHCFYFIVLFFVFLCHFFFVCLFIYYVCMHCNDSTE